MNIECRYQKGVKHLCESGITKIPRKYILPISDRPLIVKKEEKLDENVILPIIDFAQLEGPNRSQVLKSLAKACEEYGFFQVTFELCTLIPLTTRDVSDRLHAQLD